MKLRKISANLLFTGKGAFIPNGIVYLNDENQVVKVKDPGINPSEEAGVEHYNGIITPGFINTHCHIELSHFLSRIPERKGLVQFITAIINQEKAEPNIIYEAVKKADLQMRKEGIVAVGDTCNTTDSFSIKGSSKIYYHSFVEVFGLDDRKAGVIFENGLNILKEAKERYGLSASIVPHSSYAVSKELFKRISDHAKGKPDLLSIHNQECEMDYSGKSIQRLFGKEGRQHSSDSSNLANLSQLTSPLSQLILVHNVLTQKKDIEGAKMDLGKTFFSLCPNSNLYISGTLPGTFLIQNYPDNVCLGTDSLASNHLLSILEEMKTLQNALDIPLKLLLQFACYNGARALQIDNKFGEFKTGLTPGVNLIEKADLQHRKLRLESKLKVLV